MPMNVNRPTMMGAVLLCSLLFASALFGGDACCPPAGSPIAVASSSVVPPAAPPAAPDHAAHDHEKDQEAEPAGGDAHDHAAHGEGGHGQAMTYEQAKATFCEHKIAIIDCDECRYESGAVKVGTGAMALMKLETVQFAQDLPSIEFEGELALDENMVRCIIPRFPARVVSVAVRVGDSVRQDQEVAVLESQELAAEALGYLKLKAEADLLVKRLAREKMLREKKIGAEQDVQEAQSAVDLKTIEIESARGKLRLLGLTDAQINRLAGRRNDPILRGLTAIRSPLAGRVLSRDGNVGDFLSPEREFLKIAALSRIEGVGQIHEKHQGGVIQALQKGELPVVLTVDAFPGREFPAVTFGTDALINRETRTLPLRMRVDNPDELLRPGMFFHGRLPMGDPRHLPTLPQTAVLEDAGRSFVFVQVAERLFMRREVTIGSPIGGRVAILHGVQTGDAVVCEGAFLLKSDVLREKMGAGCAD